MSIGLYDVDFMKYIHVPFNLDLMKLASFYKKQKEIVVLAPKLEPERYKNFIIRKDYIDDEFDKRFFEPNVEYGGLAFTNNKYKSLKEEIELTKPDSHLYDKFKNKFCINKTKTRLFTSLVHGAHVRLSLDNKNIWKDYLKPLNLTSETRIILCHDYNINQIEGSYEAIQEILNQIPSKQKIFLGTKFPIQVDNEKDFLKWLDFNHSFFFSMQYNGLIDNELFEKILLLSSKFSIRKRFLYNPVYGLYTENDFIENVLPKIFRQVLFSRSMNIKISLKYTDNFFIDKRWERLIELFNLYCNSDLDKRYYKTYKKEYTNISNNFTLYNYITNTNFIYFKGTKNYFSLKELRELFQLVREKSYETFKMFYESCKVKLIGGEIIDV